jgi:hypothetical protein
MFHTADRIVVHTRKDWGAKPPTRPYTDQSSLFACVVHHGGEKNAPFTTDQEVANCMRLWQAFHQGPQRGWIDIGYHFIMDGRGELWQGRPTWAIGAHVLNENTGRFGICLPQDGTRFGLNHAQHDTFRKLFRVQHNKLGMPALSRLAKDPRSGFGVFGHREVPNQSTECPGDVLLADVHKMIKEFT